MAIKSLPIGPVLARRKRKITTQNMVNTPRPKLLTTRSRGQLKRMRLHQAHRGPADTTNDARQASAITYSLSDGGKKRRERVSGRGGVEGSSTRFCAQIDTAGRKGATTTATTIEPPV